MKAKWKKLYPDTYSLQDRGPAGNVAMFLLVGAERTLLIDSGYGLLDLPQLIRQITDKPVILVNTHGHLDHANGSWQFEEAFLRSEDMEVYQEHAAPEFVQDSFAKLLKHEEEKNRLAAMTAASPAKVKPLDHITEIDLGNRTVQIMHMPGHTKGSVCVIDEANKSAFTGDNLNRSIWLSLPESISVGEYKGVLELMLPVLQEKDIIWNYAAHWPRKTRLQDDIRRFILCCDAILTGSKKPRFLDAGVTSGNFVGKAGRYILYPKED